MREFGLARLPRSDTENSLTNLSDEIIREAEGYTCPSNRCGKPFSEPIKLTNLSNRSNEETYLACPFCFSRVQVEEVPMNLFSSDTKSNVESVLLTSPSKERSNEKITDERNEIVSECPHQLGYLKSRSKDAEIPDKCFTCSKILQCMSSA